ncbi:FAD-binding protein [Tessaracoccus sp. MC1679]|uniref:FAD-binding protein n=1 Tax=Tessaracoccus sp. MC1679 TaxID=2760313 RepID=UPI001600AD46|nr:FAD-binding protein [Tessaracoccus sp. MC1679]MBB1517298.1 FAD-binding protein [Tessaracoccus sp. MC1679]
MSSLQTSLPISGFVIDDSACDVDDLAFCGGVQVTVAADESWDGLVERAVAEGWMGVEALSGIPGTVADVVRANSAAYGQAVADTVASVRTWDRAADAQRTFPAVECTFVDGGSRFQEPLDDGGHRYELLDVSFLFKQGDFSAPIVDGVLAGALSVAVGARVPLAEVRAAALALPAVHETPSDPAPNPT